MGLHPSKDASHEFDHGSLIPTGIYATSVQDYDYPSVRQLILQRRLAPFYEGQQDVEYSSQPEALSTENAMPSQPTSISHSTSISHIATSISPRSILPTVSKYRPHRKNSLPPQAASKYENAVECPICFLYYPANINYTRCCHQPICSECFVHIRQPTNPSMGTATCPFCVEPNFGIVYNPPAWALHNVHVGQNQGIVTVDLIRPYHTRTRHTHYHRQSGAESANGSTRRVIVRPAHSSLNDREDTPTAQDYRDYLTAVRQMNMDLEELMVMEAIRLSLMEQQVETPQSDTDTSTTTNQTEENVLGT
ncbi:hypothetical protein BGW37DRAFT_519866 [Umbelopsis sp. PMI_123]|nr:hypothetical protein BGW37DRAFT_519866 [Umbelopsis sp. PMI_123]